jgi:N-acetyl-anhydromuramyl-L-alanine amidase AmpD
MNWRTNKMKIGKKGDKLLSVYWFVMVFLVAAAIAYMAITFYGHPTDITTLEADAMTNQIADCISSGGYLNPNVLTNDFQKNFLNICHITFNTEDFSDWKKSPQYYTEVNFYNFSEQTPSGFGDKLFSIAEGNSNLKTALLLESANQFNSVRKITYVVIHFTAGPTAASALQQIQADGNSIQYMVDRDGTVYSYDNPDSYPSAFRQESQTAGHAGCIRSGPQARPQCHDPYGIDKPNATKYPQDANCCWDDINPKSIGIEMVNLGNECGLTSGGLCDFGQGQVCKTICQDKGQGVLVNGQVWQNYTDAQISSLVNLVSEITTRYNIPVDRNHIIGHEEIDPGRKIDPGPLFPWDSFIQRVQSEQRVSPWVGKNLYIVDKNNNQYAVSILSIVGKSDKNVA